MADAPRGNGNGVSLSHPVFGSLAVTGRDLLLAMVLLALGAAAIVVQVMSLRAFQQGIGAGLTAMIDEFAISQRDRTEILHILRARACAEALAAPAAPAAQPYVSRSDAIRSKRGEGTLAPPKIGEPYR